MNKKSKPAKKAAPSKTKPSGLTLTLDAALYPAPAVQAAAYTFSDRAYVALAREGDSIVVSLKAKRGAPQPLAEEFQNEALHEVLRLRVSEQNQKLREYVVTRALVSAQEAQNAAPPRASAKPSAPPPEPAPLVDAALEKEIDALLNEIEKSGAAGASSAADPLGVTVPWQQKHGAEPKQP